MGVCSLVCDSGARWEYPPWSSTRDGSIFPGTVHCSRVASPEPLYPPFHQVAATEEKSILEEQQRSDARERKAKCEDWVPKYFIQASVC